MSMYFVQVTSCSQNPKTPKPQNPILPFSKFSAKIIK